MSLIERARSSLLHIECFYEGEDAEKRIKDILAVIDAAEAMQAEIERLRKLVGLRDAYDIARDFYVRHGSNADELAELKAEIASLDNSKEGEK